MVGTVEWKVPSFRRSAEEAQPGETRKESTRAWGKHHRSVPSAKLQKKRGPRAQHCCGNMHVACPARRRERECDARTVRQKKQGMSTTSHLQKMGVVKTAAGVPRGYAGGGGGGEGSPDVAANTVAGVGPRRSRRLPPTHTQRANAHKMLVLPAFCAASSQPPKTTAGAAPVTAAATVADPDAPAAAGGKAPAGASRRHPPQPAQ